MDIVLTLINMDNSKMNKLLAKLHNNIQGQALAEVAVCLIPLILVICFMIFFAVINKESIDASLLAQKNLANGISNTSSNSIEYISLGEDGLNFTRDDVYTLGSNGDAALYKGELITTKNPVIPGATSYKMGVTEDAQADFYLSDKEYILSNRMQTIPEDNLYLSAADLYGYEAVSENIISKNKLEGVIQVLKGLINLEDDFDIKEKVFAPKKYIDEE